MLARIGAALDSEIVAVGAGPTHLRVTGPTELSGSIDGEDVQERRRRPAVRLAAQPGPHHPAQGGPHRGGQPAARGARLPRRPDPLAQQRQRPGDHPAHGARPGAHRRGRRPADPLGDHVPRAAAAPRRHLRAAVRRRLQPGHPHRRAAHDGAAAVRPGGEGERRQLPRRGQPGHRARAPDRAHRARRHGHRERADGRRAAPGHHRHPQRLLELHGPGPLLLPAEARGGDRGHRHHHADRHRLRRDRRRRRLRAQRGPDRGDVAARGRHRDQLLDHHRAGADRVPRDRAGPAGGDGLRVLPLRGVPRPATGTPGWST